MTWLGYSTPAWLAGLAALAVPWAIHLLSRGRQRRVAVGSVRWLAPAQTLRARRLRLSRWWLLVARCLLVAAVVLALAGPRLAGSPGAARARWLLVAPEVATDRARLEAGNRDAYRALDQSLAAGDELHWLTPGLPAGDLDRPPSSREVAGGLWTLLHEADENAPPEAAWVVAALDRSEDLAGARAELNRAIEWHAVGEPAENRWLERALASDEGRLAVVVGVSTAATTRFERLEMDVAAATASGLTVAAAAGGRRVALTDGGTLATDDALLVPVANEPLAVAIFYSAERAQDVDYLRAGLEVAAEAGFRRLALRAQQADDATPAVDAERLVFWLSAAEVPVLLVDRLIDGGVLVSDALGRFERCAASLWLPAAGERLHVDRCGAVDAGPGSGDAGAALWSAADGRRVLSGARVGAGTWLRFASRWNPDWTDLVLAPQFPAWLLSLVEQAAPPAPSARSAASDRRSAGGHAVPRRADNAAGKHAQRELPLASWLWLLAFGLSAVERWLALRGAA